MERTLYLMTVARVNAVSRKNSAKTKRSSMKAHVSANVLVKMWKQSAEWNTYLTLTASVNATSLNKTVLAT